MTRKFITTVFLLFAFVAATVAQTDTATAQLNSDSIIAASSPDTFMTTTYLRLQGAQSQLLSEKKTVVNDIEQYHTPNRNAFVFSLLLAMIIVLTYLKAAFSHDLEDLLQSVINRNIAQQIFRSRTKEISFSSVVLNLNFVVAIGLFIHFIMMKYMHNFAAENISSILLIIFLFTFFYFVKIGAMKFIGIMFEAKEECDEYIFNFTTICKTSGLTLLPALFIFYTAQEKFYNFILAATILIAVYLVASFVWRGLSTGCKLMYRSVYHFFIYVCVVEVSPIFLLFKLLTKTII